MGFLYSDKNGNRVVGYKFTIKFGSGDHHKEDSVNSFAEKFVTVLEKLGVTFESDADNDPNKDRRIL
jgi:hypothetical protein